MDLFMVALEIDSLSLDDIIALTHCIRFSHGFVSWFRVSSHGFYTWYFEEKNGFGGKLFYILIYWYIEIVFGLWNNEMLLIFFFEHVSLFTIAWNSTIGECAFMDQAWWWYAFFLFANSNKQSLSSLVWTLSIVSLIVK